jgi:hypothetical protein
VRLSLLFLTTGSGHATNSFKCSVTSTVQKYLNNLKGQYHETVVETSPWSSNLGQTNGRPPFYLFKNQPFQCYGLYSSASINVKTAPDPANFAKTQRLLPRLWHITKVPWYIKLRRLWYAKVPQWHELHTFAILFLAQTATSLIHFLRLWQFVQWLCDLSISQPAQTPSHSKICQIWRPGFYIDGCPFVWTIA